MPEKYQTTSTTDVIFAEKSYHKNNKAIQQSSQQQGENKRNQLTFSAGGAGFSPATLAVGASARPAVGASAVSWTTGWAASKTSAGIIAQLRKRSSERSKKGQLQKDPQDMNANENDLKSEWACKRKLYTQGYYNGLGRGKCANLCSTCGHYNANLPMKIVGKLCRDNVLCLGSHPRLVSFHPSKVVATVCLFTIKREISEPF